MGKRCNRIECTDRRVLGAQQLRTGGFNHTDNKRRENNTSGAGTLPTPQLDSTPLQTPPDTSHQHRYTQATFGLRGRQCGRCFAKRVFRALGVSGECPTRDCCVSSAVALFFNWGVFRPIPDSAPSISFFIIELALCETVEKNVDRLITSSDEMLARGRGQTSPCHCVGRPGRRRKAGLTSAMVHDDLAHLCRLDAHTRAHHLA